MADQTVPSLTDRLAAYMVEAFLDCRGYDPGDKIDVEVTLKEGFQAVLAEMRGDQAAGTATYDGLLPPPPGDGWWDTGHTPKACDCNHHWDAHTPFRGCSVCSCKKDPPNQPPPPPVAEGVPEAIKNAAEKVMDPILRVWFGTDDNDQPRLDAVVEHDAENAAVDLSWALEGAGLLNNPTIIDEDGVDHICAALIEVGPWDEIDGDGTEASIIADHIRDLGRRLVPMCWCESPKPGAHAQSCPRFGMNP